MGPWTHTHGPVRTHRRMDASHRSPRTPRQRPFRLSEFRDSHRGTSGLECLCGETTPQPELDRLAARSWSTAPPRSKLGQSFVDVFSDPLAEAIQRLIDSDFGRIGPNFGRETTRTLGSRSVQNLPEFGRPSAEISSRSAQLESKPPCASSTQAHLGPKPTPHWSHNWPNSGGGCQHGRHHGNFVETGPTFKLHEQAELVDWGHLRRNAPTYLSWGIRKGGGRVGNRGGGGASALSRWERSRAGRPGRHWPSLCGAFCACGAWPIVGTAQRCTRPTGRGATCGPRRWGAAEAWRLSSLGEEGARDVTRASITTIPSPRMHEHMWPTPPRHTHTHTPH